jgi:hypothetical protein
MTKYRAKEHELLKKDLIVLCADKKIESTITALLGRLQAIEIRPITYEIKVHTGRDPGCYHQARDFLKPLRIAFAHALVVFDKEWEGFSSQKTSTLEENVRTALYVDWGDDAGVVVLDPELEVWVWSDSPHVSEALGWRGTTETLREWLKSQGLWDEGRSKPQDPKRAVERVKTQTRIPWTAAVCKTLAEKVSIERCSDGSFSRFRCLLSTWFKKA